MNRSTRKLSDHILTNSATLVGVCMMAISIIKVLPAGHSGQIIDKLLAIDSIIFMGSAFCSYLSMRVSAHSERLESWADSAFMFGLAIMAIGTVGMAFEIL